MRKVMATLAVSAFVASSAMALDVPANHIVDAAWLKANKDDKNLVIVDIRGKGYKEEHIAGAVDWEKKDYREGRYMSKTTKKPIPGYLAAPLTIERTMKKSGVNNDSAIVFYGAGTKSKDYRDAALGVMTSEFYGFNNVAILDGGLAGWKKAGGEVNADKVKVKKGNFSFEGRKFNQDIIATGEDIDEAVSTGMIQTIDANGKSKLHWYGKDGDKKDPRRLKEGHLPGAKALHTKEFAVEKDGVWYLGDKAFIEGKMKAAGVDLNKPMIWYCNTGHLIAGTWFATKYVLGISDANNRSYAGSMADYTRWPKRKLVNGDEK
jgi:thiosulfate/3-mercaptopyruvate sulfurtransferase